MLLTQAGEAVAKVRVSPQASSVERFAAQELSRYVGKISGARLSVSERASPGPFVYVGKAEGAEAKGMAEESFRIVCDHSGLRILGADDRGTLYGVYTFIHDVLGVSWVHFREEEETVPRRETIRVPRLDRYEEPFFSERRMVCGANPRTREGREFIAWAAKNRLNTVFWDWQGNVPELMTEEAVRKRGLKVVWGGHNFGSWMPADEYFKAHPEYFALIDNKRQPLSICATNPKVVDLHIRKILDFSAKYPGISIMGFWAYDNPIWCECERCNAADLAARDFASFWGKNRLNTYKYLKFANQVISRVAKERPGLRFELIAYGATLEPPPQLDFDIHPNANLMVALIERMYDRPLEHKLTAQEKEGFVPGLHSREDARKYGSFPTMLRKWRKLAPGPMYFYEYYTASLGCVACLFPMMFTIREDSRFYKKMGAQGFGTQGWLRNWPSYNVSYWYAPQAAWNGEASHEEILSQFCREFFGGAGDAMFRFYRTLEESFSTHRIGLPLRQMVQAFDPETVQACREHLREAKRRAGNTRNKARVEQQEILLEYGDRLFQIAQAGGRANSALAKEDWRGCYRSLSEQLGHQLRVMDLLERDDIFSAWDRERIQHFFAGRGSWWVRNEWGLFHLFKKLQHLESGI